MTTYSASARLAVPFADAVATVREALAEQGFGVLTEIDVKATMKAKLDADVEEHLILGACNPPLAHRALQADPTVGLLLPCNLVVRRDAATGDTVVEMLDPHVLAQLSSAPELADVAGEAAARLEAAMATVVARHDVRL